jgi:hypothetical protein
MLQELVSNVSCVFNVCCKHVYLYVAYVFIHMLKLFYLDVVYSLCPVLIVVLAYFSCVHVHSFYCALGPSPVHIDRFCVVPPQKYNDTDKGTD